jgi:hypothetical protein
MQDICHDIDVISSAIMAFQEGASDEKRMALWSLESLLDQKQRVLTAFEEEHAETEA